MTQHVSNIHVLPSSSRDRSHSNTNFRCSYCEKTYSRQYVLDRHIESVHYMQEYICDFCSKPFTRFDSLNYHIAHQHLSPRPHRASSSTADNVTSDGVHEQSVVPSSSSHSSSAASVSHRNGGSITLANTCKRQRLDDEHNSLYVLPDDVRKIYNDNWNSLQSHENCSKRICTYTFFNRPDRPYTIDWSRHLRDIFDRQTTRFRINVSNHLLLRNKLDGELRLFHASMNNSTLLETPYFINTRHDLDRFSALLRDTDIFNSARMVRPDTTWLVELCPSTCFYTYSTDFPIGCGFSELPQHIINNKYIYTLQYNRSDSSLYSDNLCFFRCLALFRGASLRCLQMKTYKLLKQWYHNAVDDFRGVSISELPALEKLFRVNIDIFEYDDNKVLTPVLRSGSEYNKTMRVLLYEDHFMYIVDIDKATHCFGCIKCGKLWKLCGNMKRHMKVCNGDNTKVYFKRGVYTPSQTIWEILSSHGLDVDIHYVYQYRATYDIESYFTNDTLPDKSTSTTYMSKHNILSCSVASNVPKYDKPICFVSIGDSYELLFRVIQYLEKISDAAYALLLEKFENVFEQISELEVPHLSKRLDGYLRQMPVIGFNSGRYDMNVVLPFFIKYYMSKHTLPVAKDIHTGAEMEGDAYVDNDVLEEEELDGEDYVDTDVLAEEGGSYRMMNNISNTIGYVVKRENTFMCISTDKLKWLDIISFLAPGYSYLSYLKAYNIEETKGYFCYEYITDLSKLEERHLPPHDAFYSSLKNSNITEDEYNLCHRAWADNNMKTLKDFLCWYNNKDVGPFLLALEQQVQFYADLGVDMFKDAISVPGITLRYLFKTLPKNVSFFLYSKNQSNLHKMIRDNIVGGPSIIFHRYHEKNKTRIRGGKMVKSLKGFDANALYLWALMEKMPTDFTITRTVDDGFIPHKVNVFTIQCREYLTWISHTENIELQTQFTSREMRLGERGIPVDGWDCINRTVYQFHGCLFHGHQPCPITAGHDVNPINHKPLSVLYENTVEIRQYLIDDVNVRVIEMWECEWQTLKRNDRTVAQFLKFAIPRQYPSYARFRQPTLDNIITSILDESLFGLVECDIHVPDHLREHFSEMTPIFKNIEVTRNDIGPLMREYAEQHKLLTTPRRTLIGSYVGSKILLATPLLRWYLTHGLEVTTIYTVIEYHGLNCFRQFGEKVSDARRQGDRDKAFTITSDTMKLLGNSAYGKSLTNKERHTDIIYCRGTDTSTFISNPLFKKMTQLGNDDIYEVEMLKKNILWDLPVQIGFFVYQYAKLRMLQFYYDFLDRFIDRSDFQLCETDTDSLYLALSTETIADAVRTNMLDDFYHAYDNWFPGEACVLHRDDFVCSKGTTPTDCLGCIAKRNYDKRTPGLFKLEYEGDGMISLCSKTYICFGQYDKTSAKGLSKKHNTLTKDRYYNVLDTRQSGGGKNVGFRTCTNGVFTYEQHRNSLSYFYIKRIVHDDNESTSPLNI